jgi:hypothetical protein
MAIATVDPDVFAAGSHRNMAAHLTAPLAAGAARSPIPIGAGGVCEVEFATREPLLLCATRDDLHERGLRVQAAAPGGASVALDFAPWTERGAALPLYRPPVDTSGFAVPFAVTVTAVDEDGAALDAPERLELELVEGILGRLLYTVGAEKQRLRRLGRELTAMRRLEAARDDALDRLGAELAVPRFADDIGFRDGHVVTDARREPDDEYRRRLGLYRPWVLRTPRAVRELVNGPGEPGARNAGPLGELGLRARFTVAERDNPFALAVHIVGVEEPAMRDNFLEFVRRVHLVWPHPSADPVHAERFESGERRERVEAVRLDLRDGFSFVSAGQTAAMAPMLATALARVWRCRKRLGATTKWRVKRAQDSGAGSRYELGLGIDLEPLSPAELDRLAEAHADGPATTDPEVGALLSAMTPASAAEDPEGRWLLEPCGIRTVHRVDTGTQYVSHLPAYGLAITGPDQLAPAGWTAIVPGAFDAAGTRTALLLYERSSGTGAFYATDGEGGIRLLREHSGWRTSWTRIVGGRFGAGGSAGLLFYDRADGSAEIYTGDGGGGIELLARRSGWRRSWAEIVAGDFGGGRATDFLLYDRASGEIEVLAFDPATGSLARTARRTGMRRTWSHIVPTRFAGSRRTGLVFYDRSTGLLELSTTEDGGRFAEVARHRDFGAGWTHVVAGRFGGKGPSDLLFYDRESGRAAVYGIDDTGAVDLLREHADWRPGWTHVAAGAFTGRDATGLVFYDRPSGTAEFHDGGAAGLGAPVRRHTDWRRSSPEKFEARYHAPGDPGANVVLVAGLTAADAAWQAAPHNGPAWTQLGRDEAVTAWRNAPPRPEGDAALGAFRSAGLPAVADPASVVEALVRLPQELVETVRLAPAQSRRIVAGQAAAGRALGDLVGLLRSNRIASVLPLVIAADEVVLVVGAIALPGAGTNLQDRRSAGFRWYALPLQGTGADVSATGSRASFSAADAGVYALVVIGYARTGETDPYEFRVELPPGSLLDLHQYEFLMNLLDHAHPAGVEVNTFSIRTEHVDLDGDGAPDRLTPDAARTYRAFRRRRHRGEVGVTLPESEPGG